ncbi:hypothetical protein DVH24_014237 [Malus domestica]|uniref:Tryptophan synthase beta chain-like PALP domain-containing protein n=1 Tax=Malus domestica TaxID=3750 RepID=A0A498JK20_MALDO|nr:hypothetical protein DVH24_014237 [Malus domestica]
MAALRSFLKKRSSVLCNGAMRRKLFSTEVSQPLTDSPSFAQRIRNLPKDLPGTQIKTQVSQLIGRTPIVYLNKVTEGCGAYIAVKQEMFQPTASIKDRPALSMINDAEEKGLITPGETILIEPTSGNMGISMAFMAAMRGYKMVLTMPSYTSLERRVFYHYAMYDHKIDGGYTTNLGKKQVHFETTGPEIWEDTNGQVDIFVMGIGSGGTVSGVGQYLKSKNPNVQIYGVEPAESNVLNGGKPGIVLLNLYGSEVNLDDYQPRYLVKKITSVIVLLEVYKTVLGNSEDAVNMARQLALKEGLMVGISSGANTVAAMELAKKPENKGKLIVTVHPSFGERYLSSVLFQELRQEAENMQPVAVDYP